MRTTYPWFARRLIEKCKCLGLVKLTTHSLCRGCASSLAYAGFSVLDIRNLGDWPPVCAKNNPSKKGIGQPTV